MTHPMDSTPGADDGRDQDNATQGGTVSEAGSGDLEEGTALGGADSVPDTPDSNEGGQGAAVDDATGELG